MQRGQISDDDELILPVSKSSYYSSPFHVIPNNEELNHISMSPDNNSYYFSNGFPCRPVSLSSIEDETELFHSDSCRPLNEERSLPKGRVARQGSIVDGLLHEIYDRWHYERNDSIDSDTLTECSSTSDVFVFSRQEQGGYHSALEKQHGNLLNKSFLQSQSIQQLERIVSDLQRSITAMNGRLVKQLKRRVRRQAKLQHNFDIITAILQAASLKRQIDTRMKFSIHPPPGESAFDQWRDAMKAVCRLPMGMPPEFRKKVWLSLADHYLFQLKINWEKTVKFAFNDRSNPDDEQLGMQIVKDLHRTGCSNFSGDDNDEDRAVLKRLLLAYARWNKRVGYCQGFNVIAALLLNVMDQKEDDALKVMIYLVDSVLPESYFTNNLRALSVDMAVFRDLLKLTYPKLSKHLDRLQMAAQDARTGACYEPPLTNVFTMQWFLTLFATCLPVNIVLRVWDLVLLEGSEVLLRTALTLWGKLAKRIMGVSSADEFYGLMGELSSSVMQGSVFDGDMVVKTIYSLGDFPLLQLNDLREKYRYNIRPISPSCGNSKKNGKLSIFKNLLNSDEDELDDDDIAAMACMPGHVSSSDISALGPGVYGSGIEETVPTAAPEMERMSTDIQSLKLQYERLKQRQQQAHIIIAAASAKQARPLEPHRRNTPKVLATVLVPNIESPVAMNHLFVGKASNVSRNRLITEGPRIGIQSCKKSSLLTKQLQAVANAQALSRSKVMKTGIATTSKTIEAPVTSPTKTPMSSTSPHVEVSSAKTSHEASTIRKSELNTCSPEIATVNSELISIQYNIDSSPLQALGSVTDPKTGAIVTALPADLPGTVTESYRHEISSPCTPQKNLQHCEEGFVRSKSDPMQKESSSMSPLTSQHFLISEKGDYSTDQMCNLKHQEDSEYIQDCQAGLPTNGSSKISNCDIVTSSDIDPGSKVSEQIASTEIDQDDLKLESLLADLSVLTSDEKQNINGEVSEVSDRIGSNILEEQSKKSKDVNVLQNGMAIMNDYLTSSNQVSVLEENPFDSEFRNLRKRITSPLNLHAYSNGDILERDSHLPTSAISNDTAIKESSCGLSAIPNPTATEESSLLDDYTTSSFLEESFNCSSVIATVPVSATLDVEKTDANPSGIAIEIAEKPQNSFSSQLENVEQEKISVPKSSPNLENKANQHKTIIPHKPSRHKRTQKCSPLLKANVASNNCQSPGHTAVLNTANKPFNPFPVRHFNANRAKTGLKLGLYSETTLEKLRGHKPKTPSS